MSISCAQCHEDDDEDEDDDDDDDDDDDMMMMICVLPETDVHFAFRCRLVPVHCMPNVTKTVSRTSLSTECLSAEPFNLNSVSFSQAIYTSDVSSARQNSVPM